MPGKTLQTVWMALVAASCLGVIPVRAPAETLATDPVHLTPYLMIDGQERAPEPAVRVTQRGEAVTATLETPVDGTYRFGIAVEADVIRPMSRSPYRYPPDDVSGPGTIRYPYDWTYRKQGNVLNRPRLVLPGVHAGGKLYVLDTHEMTAISFDAHGDDARALMLLHRFYNDGGDAASPDLPLRAGQRRQLSLRVFDSIQAANAARFGPTRPMRGLVIHPYYKLWTDVRLGPQQYGRIADAFSGLSDFVVVREIDAEDWIAPIFHDRDIRTFAYQYTGGLRSNSIQIDDELEREIGLSDSEGRRYAGPESPSGAWTLCDIRRPEVRALFVENARAAVEAGFDGVYLDGYPIYPDATGRRGGHAPGARMSRIHARWLLLREIKQVMLAVNPDARLGVLGNHYYDALGAADFIMKERMYFGHDHKGEHFMDDRTHVCQDLDVWVEEELAPYITTNVCYGAKGFSPIAVQSAAHFVRRPREMRRVGMGDFYPWRLERYLDSVVDCAGQTDLYLSRIEPSANRVHFEGRTVIWTDAPTTVDFSRPAWIIENAEDVRPDSTTRLEMRSQARYQVCRVKPIRFPSFNQPLFLISRRPSDAAVAISASSLGVTLRSDSQCDVEFSRPVCVSCDKSAQLHDWNYTLRLEAEVDYHVLAQCPDQRPEPESP